jgi:hypothetical protein
VRHLVGAVAIVSALLVAAPARAQQTWTVLPGLITLDGPKASIGVAFGYAPSAVGMEVEYAGTLRQRSLGRSSAGGIFLNVIVQPMRTGTLQYYGVGGLGLWTEDFANGKGTGELGAKDVGGGLMLWMTDHLAVRIDYRLLIIGDPSSGSFPSIRHPQRLSAGLHVSF